MIASIAFSLAPNAVVKSLSPIQRRVTLSAPFLSSLPASIQRRNYVVGRSKYGTVTPRPKTSALYRTKTPFRLETGYAFRPKRPSRPFPPPFVSPPSTSFSDPLTTHYQSQDRRPSVGGELIRGLTNGDDAVLASEIFVGVNDGVGAWATKPQGHAALWSRLILHFWALECERNATEASEPDTVGFLQHAFEETVKATGQWLGTTTSVTALLHSPRADARPVLYVTNIGDCKILVIRPREKTIVFRTKEQWHWFDCPMQLGTNSVDEPRNDAVLSKVDLEEDDLVVAVSDGVTDNLWEQEVLTNVLESLDKWDAGDVRDPELKESHGCMVYAAQRLLNAALSIAQDPFAESPYMEKAIDEGLTIEGGKMDDISVVLGRCKRWD